MIGNMLSMGDAFATDAVVCIGIDAFATVLAVCIFQWPHRKWESDSGLWT